MSRGESKTVSATGGVKAGNLQRGSLIPPKFIMELAEHYGKGALKYDDNNWAKGYEWSKSYEAILRHLTAFWGGEDLDVCHCPKPPEELPCKECGATGAKHIIAVAWHSAALSHFMDKFPEYDDRWDWQGHDEHVHVSQPELETLEKTRFLSKDHQNKVWRTDSYYGTRLFRYHPDERIWQTKIVAASVYPSRHPGDQFLEWNKTGYKDYVPENEGPFTEWQQ